MTVHHFPSWPSQIQRLERQHRVVRVETIAEAADVAHMLVWDAVDVCPEGPAREALRRAEAALVDAALCLRLLAPYPPENER